MLLSTAYLDEAERCDHVVVLHEGKKLAQGTPKEFKEQVGQEGCACGSFGANIKPRQIHMHLVGKEHIIDATIRSGRVRVVTDVYGTQAVDRRFARKMAGNHQKYAPDLRRCLYDPDSPQREPLSNQPCRRNFRQDNSE